MPEKTNSILQSINISIRILDVKCTSFSLSEYAKKNKKPITFDSYEFEFKLEASINEQEKTFVLFFGSKLFEKRSNAKYEIAKLSSMLKFSILNLEQIVIKDENKTGIPDQLIQACGGIAVSTIRGMYSIKLEETIYANAVVPLVDPKMFTPQKAISVA